MNMIPMIVTRLAIDREMEIRREAERFRFFDAQYAAPRTIHRRRKSILAWIFSWGRVQPVCEHNG